jgi:mannose-6-phosphate isomerase-like protein (cupin superfamily)
MGAFEISDLIAKQQTSGNRYLEFLVADTMSLGLYVLPAGDTDPQKPHTEDEIHYVVSGRASFSAGSQEREVKPGDVIFVEAGEDHCFHSITEDLTLLVVFAPPRSSLA